jgi:hypothetical protein
MILLVILSILYDPYNPSDPSTEVLVSAGRQYGYQDRDKYRSLMSTLLWASNSFNSMLSIQSPLLFT